MGQWYHIFQLAFNAAEVAHMILINYYLRHFVSCCALACLVGVSLVFFYNTMIFMGRLSGEADLTIWFNLFRFFLPYFTYIILPYACVVGSVFAINYLTDKRYILVMQSLGMSVVQLLRVLSRLFFVIVFLAVACLEYYDVAHKPSVATITGDQALESSGFLVLFG